MLKRPLILKLFALFLFIDPLLRISFISISREFTFMDVLAKTFTLGMADFFNFWFLFPLSGILLLSVKLYSYILFIGIQLYSLYFHINYESYSWPYLSEHPSSSAYVLLTVNILMVIYLLMPRSREIFFDRSLRWWERGSRYTINDPCFAVIGDKEIHGKVVDLAFGGALIELDENVPTDTLINLDFDILNKNIHLKARIVRIIHRDNKPYYGTQFIFDSKLQKFKLRLLMFSVAKVSDYEKFR